MPAYDAIVLGLGGMGSATLFHLARRGLRVLGLERFDLVHEYGSSHGLTRIIRLAYWEHPTYVALLRRAYELWRELEGLAGERLLHITGSVDAGPEDGAIFEGALKSSELHGLAHEVMDGAELHRRYPGYRLPKEIRCLYQPEGGFLLPERCDVAHVEQALALGAEVRCREQVLDWERERRARAGADVAGTLRGRAARHLRRALGLEAGPRARRPRGPGAAGARLAPADPARVLPAGRVPGLQPGGRGGPLLRLPQLPHPRVQVREVPPPRRERGSRHGEPRARSRRTRSCSGPSRGATSRRARARRSCSRPACSPTRPTATSSWTATPPIRRSRSRPASPATATSSAA